MRNKILLGALLFSVAVLLVEVSFFTPKNQLGVSTMAQIPYPTRTRTPYPTVYRPSPTAYKPSPTPVRIAYPKYVYITYNCTKDFSGETYVLSNLNRCRTSSEWYSAAKNSCYQKTGGSLISYNFSPPCAAYASSITGVPIKTPTPIKPSYYPTRTPTAGYGY